MRKINLLSVLISIGLLLSACGSAQSKTVTVEVTRMVTVEVTRIFQKTQIATVEVTRIVKMPPQVVEVTRIVPVVITASPPSPAPLDSNITQGILLQIPRVYFTATPLIDGRILLVGGSRAATEQVADVEIYDPANDTMRWAAPLHTARHAHTATLLQDGRVLVVGGYSQPSQWLDDAEVYDPTTDTWTVLPPIYPHGVEHSATLMKDGQVLVVGGCIGSGICTERVEIFNPQNNSWIETTPLASHRASHTATLLDDGRVLVAGGAGEDSAHSPAGVDALLYDPQTNQWTATGPMVRAAVNSQSILLPDGRVLVAGGMALADDAAQKLSNDVEIFNPATGTWAEAAPLSQPRIGHILVLLPNSQVVVMGGTRDAECCWYDSSFVREIESYTPATNQWQTVGTFPASWAFGAASFLPDGRVWVAGGRTNTTILSGTWLITFAVP